VIALREQGNSASQLWAVSLNVAPKTAINVAGDLVFVTGQNNHVYAINRFTSALVWEITTTGNVLQYPTAGDQLLYVANQRLTAVDIFNRETIWQSDATLFSEVSAPPVYAYPGAIAMSEVYVSNGNGTVYAFDAANGGLLWSYATGQRIDMMAVDRVRLYTVSGQTARAINRSTGTEVWRQDIGALIVGGPIVGDGQILFVTTGGALPLGADVVVGVEATTADEIAAGRRHPNLAEACQKWPGEKEGGPDRRRQLLVDHRGRDVARAEPYGVVLSPFDLDTQLLQERDLGLGVPDPWDIGDGHVLFGQKAGGEDRQGRVLVAGGGDLPRQGHSTLYYEFFHLTFLCRGPGRSRPFDSISRVSPGTGVPLHLPGRASVTPHIGCSDLRLGPESSFPIRSDHMEPVVTRGRNGLPTGPTRGEPRCPRIHQPLRRRMAI
jgi:outer membrane protein assembly factor BamB